MFTTNMWSKCRLKVLHDIFPLRVICISFDLQLATTFLKGISLRLSFLYIHCIYANNLAHLDWIVSFIQVMCRCGTGLSKLGECETLLDNTHAWIFEDSDMHLCYLDVIEWPNNSKEIASMSGANICALNILCTSIFSLMVNVARKYMYNEYV